ncbi:hypothetical protein D3C72_910060 [compost metagenome]
MTWPTSGIMTSGCTSTPSRFSSQAASKIARTCISLISGKVRPNRQPRRPIMGLDSWRRWTSRKSRSRRESRMGSSPLTRRTATSAISSSCLGRNSWSGGSSRRIVTGNPAMAWKMPRKSSRCIGRSLSRAARRSRSVPARIISCITGKRSWAMNMCSVRHNPTPSAPKPRALAESSGVSALVRTPSVRNSSAQSINCWNSPESSGSIMGTSPWMTSPVPPLMLRMSPSLSTRPATRSSLARRSTSMSSVPATQGLPMPRATTAAWLVMPPRLVSTPWAWIMPWMSSGLVSTRTRITFSPLAPRRSASSASKTIAPVAAPGLAGRPRAMTSILAFGSMRR